MGSVSGSTPVGPVAAKHVRDHLGRHVGIDQRRVEEDGRAPVRRLEAAALARTRARSRPRRCRAAPARRRTARPLRSGAARRTHASSRGSSSPGAGPAKRRRSGGAGARRSRAPRRRARGRSRSPRRSRRAGWSSGCRPASPRRSSVRPRRGSTVPASTWTVSPPCSSSTRKWPFVRSRPTRAVWSWIRPPSASSAFRSAVAMAWPVRSPTWSSRRRGGSAAAGEPVAVALARERHAELLEPRDRVRAPRRPGRPPARGRPCRATTRRCRTHAGLASRRRRPQPGSRPGPWPCCTTPSSPS